MIPAIEAHGLTKRYRLGELTPWSLWRRNGDGMTALDDVSFSIMPGETIGVIGSNGAGKSTLLKVLTRVTAPTAGHAVVRGRVGTILEVGTGFHPELTGRENIFLSGAILGLSRREIAAKFDEIVDFSGVEKFIDTPVKRYSSGMYVRLAFSVVAHLDSDILVVDEVLAVGDLRFQKRCLQRMEEASVRQGRTILFVSHNLQAVRNLCHRSILLENGHLVADGKTPDIIHAYLGAARKPLDLRTTSLADRRNRTGGRAQFTSISITDAQGEENWNFRIGEHLTLRLDYSVFERLENLGLLISFITAGEGVVVSTIKQCLRDTEVRAGTRGKCEVLIDTSRMRPGSLALYICLGNEDASVFEDVIDSNVRLPFLEIDSPETDIHLRSGYFEMDYKVRHETEQLAEPA